MTYNSKASCKIRAHLADGACLPALEKILVKNRIGYILVAYASMLCYGLLDNSRGPAYPYILDRFQVSNQAGSMLFAIASFAGLIMISFGRAWLGRIGELGGQRLFLFLMFFGASITGIADRMGGFPLLLCGSFILGLGLGGSTLSTNILVAFGTSASSSRRVFSGLHSMYGIASITAPLLFAVSIKAGIPWSTVIIAFSFTPLLVLVASSRTSQFAHEPEKSRKPDGISAWTRSRVGLIVSFYVAGEIVLSSRMVFYLSKESGMNPADASYYLGLFFTLLLTGRLLFSSFHFRWSSFAIMLTSIVSSILLFILGIALHPMMLSMCGFSMSFYFPCAMDWISKRYGTNAGYMMTSVMASVAALSILMHWGVGTVADIAGARTSISLGPLFLLLSLIVMISTRGEFIGSDGSGKKSGHTPKPSYPM